MSHSRSSRISGLVVGLLAATALVLPATPASAAVATPAKAATTVKPAGVTVSASAVKKMRAAWNSYGVSKKTQDKLIKKLKAGKAWDSLTKSKAKKTKTTTKNGYRTKIYTFADGSIRVAKMQRPAKPITTTSTAMRIAPTAVAACSVTETHYSYVAKGCVASNTVILVTSRMTVDYGAMSGSGDAQISRAYDGYVSSILLGTAGWNEPYKVSDREYHMVFWIDGLGGLSTSPQILTVKSIDSKTLEARADA